MKHLEVTAAIIINKNEVLCMQRGAGKFDYISYKFEFPGGKVEVGETKEECLRRELMEELGIDTEVKAEDHFLTVNHSYPDFTITMHSFICNVSSRKIDRKEHVAEVWLPFEKLNSLEWAPADVPIVNKLMEVSSC